MNKEIWLRFQNGDKVAFHGIYNKYIDLLYGYGMKIMPNREFVDEHIQSVFIYLWEHRLSIACPQNVAGYLIVSLRNLIIRDLKKQNDMDIISMDICDVRYGFELVPDVQETLIQSETDEIRMQKLKKGLSLLTAREREVLYLRFYKNMSVEDTAAIMCIKQQSVCNIVQVAIKKLRNYFALALLSLAVWCIYLYNW